MSFNLYSFSALSADGSQKNLADYTDKVVLVVNTASKCGFTSQYRELQSLYSRYKARGFSILAFPCNQFAAQEPGSTSDIIRFCQVNYGVNFPVFEKIQVNGAHTHPLYTYLKSTAPGLFGSEVIKWNFTKFLINRQGHAVARFAPITKPEALAHEIERLLDKID